MVSRAVVLRLALLAGVTWFAPVAMWAHDRFLDARADYSDQGIEGPYAAVSDGDTNLGRPRWRIGPRLTEVHPGDTVAWVSTVCLEAGTYMLAHTEMARLSDGAVVARHEPLLWTPEDKRCGPAIGALQVPNDADPGAYEIRRIARARPLSKLPLDAPLASLRFRVTLPPESQ